MTCGPPEKELIIPGILAAALAVRVVLARYACERTVIDLRCQRVAPYGPRHKNKSCRDCGSFPLSLCPPTQRTILFLAALGRFSQLTAVVRSTRVNAGAT